MRCQHLTLRLDPQFASIDEQQLNQLIKDADLFSFQAALVPGAAPYWSVLLVSREREPAAPRPGAALKVSDRPLMGAEASLYELLREWRAERSKEENLPPYIIAHNASLRAIAQNHTAITSLDDLARVERFGPRKVARYGADILAILGQSTPDGGADEEESLFEDE